MSDHQADGKTIVHIDESGFVHDMPRLYGYAPIGLRCYDTHHWKAYGRINAIGALIGAHLFTIGLFQANIDTQVFTGWLVQDLLPKLPNGCIIVMDNAAFHKSKNIKRLIESGGHTLKYLPPYSPDLDPIEKKWAQAKAIKRTFQCDMNERFHHYSI